jgi:hypothetical protein
MLWIVNLFFWLVCSNELKKFTFFNIGFLQFIIIIYRCFYTQQFSAFNAFNLIFNAQVF